MDTNEFIKIIEEEISGYLNEVGLCHNNKGHFTKCNKGVVYSLTKDAASKNKIDKRFVGRGTVTSKEKRKPAKLKTKAGMNAGPKTSAGRKLLDGDDIPPKYRVKGYKGKYYQEELSPETGLPVQSRYKPSWPSSKKRKREDRMGKPDRIRGSWVHGNKELRDVARMKGLYEGVMLPFGDVVDVVMTAIEKAGLNEQVNVADECKRMGYVKRQEAQRQILLALNNFALAADGKLFTTPKQG